MGFFILYFNKEYMEITITEKELLENSESVKLGEYVKRKFNEQFINENSYDKCVICGKESPYLRSTHIDVRIGYVEGAGQGCFQTNICD